MNKDIIVNWNDKRVQQEEVVSFFKEVGNFFSFTLDEKLSDKLHIYFGISEAENSFYVIKESEDVESNESFLAHALLSNTKKKLPQLTLKEENNDHSIPWEKANQCINNWINDSVRKSWIDERFASLGSDKAIFLAFVVDSADVKEGKEHDFYLSLKDDENGSFDADLIVVNKTDGIISQNIEDMVHSVPPFGDDYAKFGLLKSLDIK
ncbi:MAG: hypothetical protein N4A35_09060 [Flavobacteriales bacterium]|jgi:hypothetical protein|nr:hypothetical protein [Flavobacteriales bacterium]